MKHLSKLLLLGAFVFCFSMGYSQKAAFRFLSWSINDGSTFYALNGTTGQLHFMHDTGTSAGIWKKYGEVMRSTGTNNLAFAAVSFSNGTGFYALETNTGQLHFMLDFGSNTGKWATYGSTIKSAGDYSFQFSAEASGNGTKFTAMDGNSGQVYYMFDMGPNAGTWKEYGGVMSR